MTIIVEKEKALKLINPFEMYAIQSAYVYYFGEDIIMSDKSKQNIKQSKRSPS